MEVKDFSNKIVDASSKNIGVKNYSFPAYLAFAAGWSLSHIKTYPKYFGNYAYHFSGFLSGLAREIFDIRSTEKVIKYMKNPKFFEYGLDKNYFETHKYFSRHPTQEELRKKGLLKTIGFVGLSTIYPPVAHGGILGLPLAYKHNSNIAKQVKNSIEIGDKVKEMLANSSEEEINLYLDVLINKIE